MGHREGSKDAPAQKTARSRQDRRLQRASHGRREKWARPGGALLAASGDSRLPVGAGPSLGVCSRADNARAFPATLRHYARELNTSLTATRLGGCRARPARQQAYSPTQWGEGSGPREFLSPQPSPPGANNPGLQPPDRPEWLHEAAHSLRGVGTAR